jgi:uncharacterized protein (TIGR03435 family)
MKNAFLSMLAASAIIVALTGQELAPVPYVASVKKSGDGVGGQMLISPATISAKGLPARLLIRQAFGPLQDFQIVGGPSWMNSDRFDIEAKPEGGGPMSPQVLQSVLRQILQDRFALEVHKETRELPMYALMLARSDGRLGPNLTPSSDECAAMMSARGSGPARDGRAAPPPDGRGGRGGPDRRGGPGPGRAGGAPVDFDAPVQCGQRRGAFGRLRAGGTTMTQLAEAIS